jgi:hypothetical protein
VTFGTVGQLQDFTRLYSKLNLLNRPLVRGIWDTAKALLLNEPTMLQADLPLLDAPLDRRAGD